VLGYGALNALLFITYNRTLALLTNSPSPYPTTQPTYAQIYLAGILGGLATFVVSTPTELIKVRAQLVSSASASSASSSSSSFGIARQIVTQDGVRGLYRGGVITAVRDAVGYGFYFCAYDAAKQALGGSRSFEDNEEAGLSAWKILMAGGIAGCVSWASIFPLDVVKTRIQGVPAAEGGVGVNERGGEGRSAERSPLLGQESRAGSPAVSITASERSKSVARSTQSPSTINVAIATYQEGGLRIFFRGLGVCSIRAFVVNAVQWAVYEWVMEILLQKHKAKALVSV
jgi:solute carrier family 25 (mitochondrial carnitine/acylcarnitine transporter), member 20/29